MSNNTGAAEHPNNPLDLFFLENRAKVLDLAAFMDRFERNPCFKDLASDPRWIGICRSIEILNDGSPDRAKRILELWSDPTEEPVPTVSSKGALGVWPGLRS